MASFVGDHPCKVDTKGRILFPSALKKQLGKGEHTFVIKKDLFESCLVIYTMTEWKRQTDIIKQQINNFNKEHNRFLRGFYRGTIEVSLDGNGRLLVPRRMLDVVSVEKEIVMSGQDAKIELWSKSIYDGAEENEDDFAALAEKIMMGPINEEE